MDNMLCLRHTEIKSTFERSLGAVLIAYQVPLLKLLRGKTSFFALDLILKEMRKISCVALDASVCDHLNQLVYGLPYANEIYKYHSDGLPIPIEIVDDHWRQLNYIPQVEESLEFVHTAKFAYIKKLFDSSTAKERKVLLLKLREIALPAMTSILEPKIEKHKGRPSGSKNKSIRKQVKRQKSTKRDPSTFEIAKIANEIPSQASVNKKLPPKRKNPVVKFDKCDVKTKNSDFKYLAYLPAFLHQYIGNVEDVMGDGNCGFCCVAEQVDK